MNWAQYRRDRCGSGGTQWDGSPASATGVVAVEQVGVSVPEPEDHQAYESQHYPDGDSPNLHTVFVAQSSPGDGDRRHNTYLSSPRSQHHSLLPR